MAGSSFGSIFRFTTWGESHGKALGCVIDGCPAGLPLTEEDLQIFLNRRKPGQNAAATSRKEDDLAEILSGVFEGRTTGCPICVIVRNTSQISADYSEIASCYRPGHADYTYDAKFGFRDYRGGGRSSGRETIGRVIAGAIASKILKTMNIEVHAYTKSIGPVSADCSAADYSISLKTATAMPDYEADKRAMEYLMKTKEECDSAGGVMECVITGLPAGIGDPVFEKLDANLAKAVMSIGAVKAVEIGDGCEVSSRKGSENNDPFRARNGSIVKLSNHAGGILGGISDGNPVLIRAHVKPTPSIFRTQQTVDQTGKNTDLQIKGRHDPVIVPRAVVVMECMAAATVLDALMLNMSSKMESLHNFYKL